MKKLLTFGLLFAAVACSNAQGLIQIANSSSTLITASGGTYGAGGPILANTAATAPANSFIFGLFVAPGGTAAPSGVLDAGWQFVGAYAYNSTSTSAAAVGRLLTTTPTITGYDAGSTVNFIMRGWSANAGSTWTEVKNFLAAPTSDYYFGSSTLAVNAVLGGGAIGTPSAFGTGTAQIGGFNLTFVPVPEPTTFALAGLGAAAMLIFRRRQ